MVLCLRGAYTDVREDRGERVTYRVHFLCGTQACHMDPAVREQLDRNSPRALCERAGKRELVEEPMALRSMRSQQDAHVGGRLPSVCEDTDTVPDQLPANDEPRPYLLQIRIVPTTRWPEHTCRCDRSDSDGSDDPARLCDHLEPSNILCRAQWISASVIVCLFGALVVLWIYNDHGG